MHAGRRRCRVGAQGHVAAHLVFGGFFPDGGTLAVLKTPKPDEAMEWVTASGFWDRDALTARPWLYVL